jgi:two-component system, cell cycle sensor histidine kinase and response regulator CckA
MPAKPASDTSREIERLYRLDYGDPAEFWFRIGGSVVGALVIWLYTGWMVAWVWILGYAALHLTFFLFLRAKLSGASRLDVLLAHVFFPLLLISFIWMPILMITSSDDVLSASGFTILSGVIVFLVRRSEEYLEMMLFEIGVLSACLGIGVATILLRYDDPLAWLGLIFGASTLVFYVTQSSLIVRKHRIRADELAVRTSQAEKLEAIGKLAGGVAHDFNNLLTVIIGNLDLLKEVNDPVSQERFLEDAKLAALRGARVVSQLLSYARQTTSTSEIAEITVLLLSVERMCSAFLPDSVSLDVQLPSEAATVFVDEALFGSAMLNLIRNSIDALEGVGKVTITASIRHFSKATRSSTGQLLGAGDFVEFLVADTGSGIPPEILNRVTDPFFTTKAFGKGSGLGLSMVAGFAAQSGGGLEIQSSDNGTVVSLLLPVAKPLP